MAESAPPTDCVILCVRLHSSLAAVPELYGQLAGLMRDVTPRVEEAAGEAAVLGDVRTAMPQWDHSPLLIAGLLQAVALHRCGLPTMIGLGPNPMLARMAAVTSPGTIRSITSTEAAAAVRVHDVAWLPSIGRTHAPRLRAAGLRWASDIADADLITLQPLLGADRAERARQEAHGADDRRIEATAAPPRLAAPHLVVDGYGPVERLWRRRTCTDHRGA